MSLPELLVRYGYLAILIGSLFEGETILLLAGFAIHQGYLSFPAVAVLGCIGGALGDQGCFFIGRYYGERVLLRFPRFIPAINRVTQLIQRYHTSLILAVRFMYGLRIVGPMAIGMSKVSIWRFIPLNLFGAAIWALLVVSMGYLFGQTIEWLLMDIKRYQEWAIVLFALLLLVVFLMRRWLRRRNQLLMHK